MGDMAWKRELHSWFCTLLVSMFELLYVMIGDLLFPVKSFSFACFGASLAEPLAFRVVLSLSCTFLSSASYFGMTSFAVSRGV